MTDQPVNLDPNDPLVQAVDAAKADVGIATAVYKESKAGYKTTEFWGTVIGLIAVNVQGLVVSLPDKWQAIASAGLLGLYAISRGLSKAGVPHIGK